jgi:hypothetical protein
MGGCLGRAEHVIALVQLAMVLTLCDPTLPQSAPGYCNPEFHHSEAVPHSAPQAPAEQPDAAPAVEEPVVQEPTPEPPDEKHGHKKHDGEHRHHHRDREK